MNGYSVIVNETSKALTAKQRVQIKDTSDCVRLDEATQDGPVLINVDYWAVLTVHNEKAEDKEYNSYVVADKDGIRYITGSKSFWDSFMNIYTEMSDIDDDWQLKVYRMDSKNRAGKQFITCAVV